VEPAVSDARIQSFSEFFPYYLGEHRVPSCRWLHFAGTSLWLSMLVTMFVLGDPIRAATGLGVTLLAAVIGMRIERKRRPLEWVVVALAGILYAHPVLGAIAMVGAYGFAWAGHFGVEKNRPATFQYPFMSLAGDHAMYLRMWTGRLWTGDTVPAQAS
jgi:hypothetical protein